jgi:DNA ligase-associated metallophosphoesterase
MFLPEHDIHLLPGHALLIVKEEIHLVAADLHIGKSAAFRAQGLPVPEGDTARDLKRLSDLVETHEPAHLVIAGDLFHAASGQTEEVIGAFLTFLSEIEIPFTLVKGNHDRKIKDLPAELDQTNHLDIAGIRIVHKPEDSSDTHFNICGHIHPVVKIPDGKNTSLRLPCFHLRENILTLPSFGSFTGGHVMKTRKHDRFFVSHMGKVIEVPDALL